MEQQPQKKEWTKPELIVLVRSKPEEAVLAACKILNSTGSVTSTDVGCINNVGEGCVVCSAATGS